MTPVIEALLVSVLAGVACAFPHVAVKRQVSHLRESYDFIIAGGGTSGLTVADRLTEAFPKKTVLVIEYGDIHYAPGVFDPPVNPAPVPGDSRWSLESLPNPEVKNKIATPAIGKMVGGSSAINGQFFDRPSRFDFEAWAQVGSPEFNGSKYKWNWDGIFPYFKKSVTFTAPSASSVKEHGYTWDTAAFGNSTPVHSSFPPFQWGDHQIGRDGFKDMGIPILKECGGGDKEGLCWVPVSQHPVTARRSHSGLAHYAEVNTTRPNYDLLVKHQVVRVIYPNGVKSGPPLVEMRSLAGGDLFNVTAKAEVVLSAGSIHTPTILQRSGIGPGSFLKSAGIATVIDLPGVGSNFQDHVGPGVYWNNTEPVIEKFYPLADEIAKNATFRADATKGFDEIPARGPYTLAMSNSAIYVSLPNITSDYKDIISRIRAQAASDNASAPYLPPDYRTDARMIAGYRQQLSAIADFLANPRAPSMESPWSSGAGIRAAFLHPLSRGTVRINASKPLDVPIIDYRILSNPIDTDVHVAHVQYLRRLVTTPTLQAYKAVEISPGIKVQEHDALVDYVKDNMVLSYMHPCCTAGMMPESKGGVIGPDMRVHGASGLRIVDMSVLPLLPSSHLSAQAYAVAEKAADIIIADWK